MRILEDFLDTIDLEAINQKTASRKVVDTVSDTNYGDLEDNEFDMMLSVEMQGVEDYKEHPILRNDSNIPADYKIFYERLEQLLISIRQIEDFLIQTPVENIERPNIDDSENLKRYYLKFAFNHSFTRFSEVYHFFYRLIKTIFAYKSLFVKVGVLRPGSNMSLTQLASAVTPTIQFYAYDRGWIKIGSVSFSKSDLDKDYIVTSLKKFHMSSAPLLCDERHLPDYKISPQQAGFGNIDGSLDMLLNKFKQSYSNFKVSYVDTDELNRVIDANYLKKTKEFLLTLCNPKHMSDFAKNRFTEDEMKETWPTAVSMLANYGLGDRSEYNYIDYALDHAVKIYKTRFAIAEKDNGAMIVMWMYVGVNFSYSNNKIADDVNYVLHTHIRGISTIEHLYNFLDLVEGLVGDFSNTTFMRKVLEKGYSAGLE